MGDEKPRVSIGVPVFNGENFLEEALDSILAQTYRDFELIISDNASTDRTEEICAAYAARDKRIRYHRNEKNLGAAKNFNQVFELSTGEYFKWASHDDVCAPQYIERCVSVLDSRPSVVLCYGKTVIVDEQGTRLKAYDDCLDLHSQRPHERYERFHDCFGRAIGAECNAVFGVVRASALKMTPLIGSYPASDTVLLGRLALLGKFHEIPEPLFFRRDHPLTSVRANRDFDKRLTWFCPEKEGRIQLVRWRWFLEYLLSISRVQMSCRERILCYAQMRRWLQWHWREMKFELSAAARRIAKRSALIVLLVSRAKDLTSLAKRVRH